MRTVVWAIDLPDDVTVHEINVLTDHVSSAVQEYKPPHAGERLSSVFITGKNIQEMLP